MYKDLFNSNLNWVLSNISYLLKTLSPKLSTLKKILISLWLKVNFTGKFIYTYYVRNEHLWLDGYLFDFLQKKTADMWLRKFVIYTGFLFSERLVFDSIVKLYIDYLVWYMHKFTIFEVNNVFEMLSVTIFFTITLFFMLILIIVLF